MANFYIAARSSTFAILGFVLASSGTLATAEMALAQQDPRAEKRNNDGDDPRTSNEQRKGKAKNTEDGKSDEPVRQGADPRGRARTGEQQKQVKDGVESQPGENRRERRDRDRTQNSEPAGDRNGNPKPTSPETSPKSAKDAADQRREQERAQRQRAEDDASTKADAAKADAAKADAAKADAAKADAAKADAAKADAAKADAAKADNAGQGRRVRERDGQREPERTQAPGRERPVDDGSNRITNPVGPPSDVRPADAADVGKDAEQQKQQAREKRNAERASGRPGLESLKNERRERKEEGGRIVIEEPGNRVIVRDTERNRVIIRHDETERLRRSARDVRRERRDDGTSLTIVTRAGGVNIGTVTDENGRLLRRYRKGPNGREITLLDNRRHYRAGGAKRSFFDVSVDLAAVRIAIPRNKYIVEYEGASEDDIYEALNAPPVEKLDRDYSVAEVLDSRPLRERMRSVELNAITFEFGSWTVAESDITTLRQLSRAINRVLKRKPDEMFLIEGYTDAVGSDEDNLSLSDRRAEAVAVILTEEFQVPPENLLTQGYGEQFLKVETDQPEQANRRVVVRPVGRLLARNDNRRGE